MVLAIVGGFCEDILKDITHIPLVGTCNGSSGELKLVGGDPAREASITLAEIDGKQVITYSFREFGIFQVLTLNDAEVDAIFAWKNSGRRNSFWNWPGWGAMRARCDDGQ